MQLLIARYCPRQAILTEMNVQQLANVISDISDLTGMAIIQAILDGERD